MDPLGNIPVLKNAKFIKTFLANLEGWKLCLARETRRW
jgi:hypothetical protein